MHSLFICWFDFVSNDDVLARTGFPLLSKILVSQSLYKLPGSRIMFLLTWCPEKHIDLEVGRPLSRDLR